MTRIEPTPREELEQHEPIFQMVEGAMGFVPSSMRVMAKVPALFETFAQFAGTISNMGYLEPGFGQLVANVASHAAGCRYCQAHTGAHATHAGIDAKKVEQLWEFETSEIFSDAERAALRIARDAALVPNAVTDEHFSDLSKHYSEEAIIQIVATIGLFGYLNRWNDTMATTLEDEPMAFASEHLGPAGWEAGKHATKD